MTTTTSARSIADFLALEERDGMIFDDWYTDEGLTEKFDFTKPVEHCRRLFSSESLPLRGVN